jgi:predicted kinase
VLQASYMRKWMTERLKRRKKPGEGSPKEGTKAPEPLQPRFYDNDPAAPAEAAVEAPVVESRRAPRPSPQPEAEDVPAPTLASSTAEPSAVTSRPRTARRRRSRGGRGGSRQRPAPANAKLPGETADLPSESGPSESPQAQPSAVPSASAAATHSVPAPARASKGTVVLAIGLPGSGKSSWFKRHNIHPLSSDLLRELLFDDAQEQRFQDLVFSNLRSMLKARLIARRPMNYVDATNLTPQDRHSWIKLAKDYGYDVQGVFFDVPLEVCMERHQRRGRVVPEDIMRKMAGKLKAPTFDEGFSKITVVRVKQKEEAAG